MVLIFNCAVPLRSHGQERRDLLASGYFVPGLGRIGYLGFYVLDIDDRGRLLLHGRSSDGRIGLYWATDSAITPIWATGEPASSPIKLDPRSARSNRSGVIAALGSPIGPTGVEYGQDAIYLLSPRHARGALGNDEIVRLVGVGDSGPDGERFRSIEYGNDLGKPVINDAVQIAFEAIDESWSGAGVYVVDQSGHIETVVRPARVRDGWIFYSVSLISIAEDGSVRFLGARVRADDPGVCEDGVFLWRDGRIERVLYEGMRGPSGGVLTRIGVSAASRSGELAFEALEDAVPGVYRTWRGTLIHTPMERSPDDRENGEVESLNDAGDIAGTTLVLQPASDRIVRIDGIIHYADGRTETVPDTSELVQNDAGDLGFLVRVRNEPVIAVHRRDGVDRVLLTDGDPAPQGGYFGVWGLGPTYLDASGLIVSLVTLPDESRALICGGDAGFVTVAKTGDSVPGGRRLGYLSESRIISPDELFFVGIGEAEGTSWSSALYRATPLGVDLIADSEDPYYDYFSNMAFNRHGATVTYHGGDDGGTFTRVMRGGQSETLQLSQMQTPAGDQIQHIVEYGVADDGTIVAIAAFFRPWGNANAVVAINTNLLQVIISAEDDLSPRAGSDFSHLHVAGNDAWFVVEEDDGSRILRYRVGDPMPRALPGDLARLQQPEVGDVTPEGRALIGGYLVDDEDGEWSYHQFIVQGDHFEPVLEATKEHGFAGEINDRGNVLFDTAESRLGAYRPSVSLSGPPAVARCLGMAPQPITDPGTTVGGSAADGCVLTDHPSASNDAMMLVCAGATAFAARRYRQRFASSSAHRAKSCSTAS